MTATNSDRLIEALHNLLMVNGNEATITEVLEEVLDRQNQIVVLLGELLDAVRERS